MWLTQKEDNGDGLRRKGISRLCCCPFDDVPMHHECHGSRCSSMYWGFARSQTAQEAKLACVHGRMLQARSALAEQLVPQGQPPHQTRVPTASRCQGLNDHHNDRLHKLLGGCLYMCLLSCAVLWCCEVCGEKHDAAMFCSSPVSSCCLSHC
jgi:hypothetical protein